VVHDLYLPDRFSELAAGAQAVRARRHRDLAQCGAGRAGLAILPDVRFGQRVSAMVFYRFKRKHTMEVVEALAGHRGGRLVLVDVREDSERARGFPPGSRHLPLLELKQRLAELPSDRPVAVICQSGRRSAMAATAARRAGLDAYNVSGGMTAWHRRGLDTTTPGRTR
jgi:rhodanese-related sulfurtransferase